MVINAKKFSDFLKTVRLSVSDIVVCYRYPEI